jgi:hypothetical protein
MNSKVLIGSYVVGVIAVKCLLLVQLCDYERQSVYYLYCCMGISGKEFIGCTVVWGLMVKCLLVVMLCEY